MSCSRSLPPLSTSLVITNLVAAYLWENQWQAVTGISSLDFTLDLRNLTLGPSAAVALKPALQYAAVRTDRPSAGAAITAGSAMTANGAVHYAESINPASQYYVRRGIEFKLTAGAFAQVDALLYTSFLHCGLIGQPRQIEFMPNNNNAAIHYYSLLPMMAAVGVGNLKLAVIGVDNLNNTMQIRAAGRAFNDPMARGSWVNLESAWNTPAAGDFGYNTGEIDLSSLSLGSHQFVEFANAIRKSADGDANSRVALTIFPSIKFT